MHVGSSVGMRPAQILSFYHDSPMILKGKTPPPVGGHIVGSKLTTRSVLDDEFPYLCETGDQVAVGRLVCHQLMEWVTVSHIYLGTYELPRLALKSLKLGYMLSFTWEHNLGSLIVFESIYSSARQVQK